jgi:hypothetical protein
LSPQKLMLRLGRQYNNIKRCQGIKDIKAVKNECLEWALLGLS